MDERIISPAPLAEEGDDLTIRPERLAEFIGQVQVKES
ncbi:MAG TPA: Holliday junction branch migration DNA helicase RuvB, partial [Methanoregula sp.]|nr:Holliday junction branch migration DNA helicase RuvB [Methanoregula sp.]